jgi:proteasome lid subunit RPN8/RPN11
MATLYVTAGATDALARAYDRALPLEACGALLGAAQRDWFIVNKIVIASGPSGYPGEFEIPDYDLRRMGAYAEICGLRIAALFHSHPSGDSSLSVADRAALLYSAWPWVIVTRPNRTSAIALTGYASGDATRIGVRVDVRRANALATTI